MFDWDADSTYVRKPPVLRGQCPPTRSRLTTSPPPGCLLRLGDSITTDHISPAGSIKADSPAGQYLTEHGVEPQGVQLVRIPSRQPRGDDSRHLRQYPVAQPAGAGNRGRVYPWVHGFRTGR